MFVEVRWPVLAVESTKLNNVKNRGKRLRYSGR